MNNSIAKALDVLSGAEEASGSIAEAVGKLDGLVISDGAAAVAAALGPTGDITQAIGGAIDAGIDDDPKGDIYEMAEAVASAAISAELGEGGDISGAIGNAIDAAVDDDPKGSAYSMAEAVAATEFAKHVAGNQADSTATDVAELLMDFNGLLTKLKAAGLMDAE